MHQVYQLYVHSLYFISSFMFELLYHKNNNKGSIIENWHTIQLKLEEVTCSIDRPKLHKNALGKVGC
jgi:hypothetical protein